MSKQVMITLNLIQGSVHSLTWMRVLEANGGVKADCNQPFPLSSVLDSNSLNDTLECFKALPEYTGILEKFALFCVKEASKSTRTEAIHNSVRVLERYVLEGDVALETLRDAYSDVYDIVHSGLRKPHTADNSISRAVMHAIDIVRVTGILPSPNAAAYGATNAAYHSTLCYVNPSVATEVQKQEDYLRKLLDGEEYGKPEVPVQLKTGLWSLLTKPFKRQSLRVSNETKYLYKNDRELLEMSKLEKTITTNKPDTGPYYPSVEELRKAAKSVYTITEEDVAKDLYIKLNGAANMIEELQDLATWMSGCGYPFHASEYFCRKERELSIKT